MNNIQPNQETKVILNPDKKIRKQIEKELKSNSNFCEYAVCKCPTCDFYTCKTCYKIGPCQGGLYVRVPKE